MLGQPIRTCEMAPRHAVFGSAHAQGQFGVPASPRIGVLCFRNFCAELWVWLACFQFAWPFADSRDAVGCRPLTKEAVVQREQILAPETSVRGSNGGCVKHCGPHRITDQKRRVTTG